MTHEKDVELLNFYRNQHYNDPLGTDEQKLAEVALRELDQAEQDGRLVVLPCKVGDMVYRINYNTDACRTCILFSSFYGMDCLCDKGYDLYPKINAVDNEYCPQHFIEVIEKKTDLKWIFYYLNDFGKTVFLTREEAEVALAKKGGVSE